MTAHHSHSISNQNNRYYILLLIVFRILRGVSAGMITLTFPYLILIQLHHSAFKLGLIYTAATIATALFGLLFGFMADIHGRKNILIIVALLLPVSSILIYLSKSLSVIFIGAILGGYSATGSLGGGGVGGAAIPIRTAIIADLAKGKHRTFYFSLITFLGGLAAASGALLVKLLTINDTFLIATILSLMAILAILPIRLKNIKGNPKILKSKTAISKFTLTSMLNGLSQGLIVPFIIPFFVIVYHLPKSEMATYAFISGFIGSFSLLLAPRLDHTLGFVKSIVLTRGLGIILTVLFPIIRILPISVGIYFLIPALRVAAIPVQQSAMADMIDQDELGRAFGINQVSRLAASSGGTMFTGYIFALSLIGLPFYIYGTLMTVNIYLYTKFFKK